MIMLFKSFYNNQYNHVASFKISLSVNCKISFLTRSRFCKPVLSLCLFITTAIIIRSTGRTPNFGILPIISSKNVGSIISSKYYDHLKSLDAKKQIIISYLEFQHRLFINYSNSFIDNRLSNITIIQNNDLYTSISNKNKQCCIDQNSNLKIITKQSILETVSPQSLEKDKYVLKTIIETFIYPNIPATNWTKLLLFERIFIKLKLPRGYIHDSLIAHVNNDTDIAHKIIVHNAIGNGDVNFISELNQAYQHCVFIKENLPNLEIKEYNMLHSNKIGSDDFKGSNLFTGQKDCDVKLIIKDIKFNKILVRYIDIKQKELDTTLDTKHLYLKINYTVNGSNNYIVDKTGYAHDYLNMCEQHLQSQTDEKIEKFLQTFKNISDFNTKMHILHEFVLVNADNPNIRMTVMISTKIFPQESVFENISKEYASKMSDNIFNDQHEFNQFFSELTYKAFPKTINLCERVKTQCVSEMMNNFKSSKSKFLPDFVEKNYKGFTDILNSNNE